MERILISRTDAIGDVVLTLPLCGALKKYLPKVEVLFLGRTYTKEVIAKSKFVDGFVNADDLLRLPEAEAVAYLKSLKVDAIIHVFPNKQIASLAKKAGIAMRVGNSHRLFHLTTVNEKINLGRKNSNLHEAQLNFALLSPLSPYFMSPPELKEIPDLYGFEKNALVSDEVEELLALAKGRKKIILHPLSNASAREWGLAHFSALIDLLDPKIYMVYISGTQLDVERLSKLGAGNTTWSGAIAGSVAEKASVGGTGNVTPSEGTQLRLKLIAGKLNLKDFIDFIGQCDGLVAASTGPLHIASALGIAAVGIYPPMRPIHPGRWKPVGQKALHVSLEKSCNDCKKTPQSCACMNAITPEQVYAALQTALAR